MGWVRHHAIIVTTDKVEYINQVRAAALAIFNGVHEDGYKSNDRQVSEVVYASTNGYYTLLIGPDGSKEGWGRSDQGDDQREAFLAKLRELYEAGVYCDWVEVSYGGDESRAEITEAEVTCHGMYAPEEDEVADPGDAPMLGGM